ncbi:MAG: Mur ligase domain-containing protein, partial [Flavitalea sp.]
MAILSDILFRVKLQSVQGSTAVEVTELQIDSRKVNPGAAFIAIRGMAADGHQFIDMAVSKGASAVICETMPAEKREGITYVQVENSSAAAGFMAHHFYGQPSSKLKLVGVTGTNGKTTIVTLLYKLFTDLGYTCGLLSTVQNHIGEKIIPATHTTP